MSVGYPPMESNDIHKEHKGTTYETHWSMDFTIEDSSPPNDVLLNKFIHRQNIKHKVLLLGSGFITQTVVDTLFENQREIELVIASNDLETARQISKGRAKTVYLDVKDGVTLNTLVKDKDLVISLLPAHLHVPVAERCIQLSVNMITASYTSTPMLALHKRAKEADIILLNELGLDPGLDNMSAVHLINQAKIEGYKVNSFVSWCGGLPAPEHGENPLGYKFSWCPEGVLKAASNGAVFKLDGETYEIEGNRLMQAPTPPLDFFPNLNLQGIPNRNSLHYLNLYDLPKDIHTVFRGTLRYQGFKTVLRGFKCLRLLSEEVLSTPLKDWSELVPVALNTVTMSGPESDEADPKDAKGIEEWVRMRLVKEMLGGDQEEILNALVWFRLLKGTPPHNLALPPLPEQVLSPLAYFTLLLSNFLSYKHGERDMVLLFHKLEMEDINGTEWVQTSSLISYGDPQSSDENARNCTAMAKLVGIPLALGALLILDGEITKRGIMGPTEREVYTKLLPRLEKRGIKMLERRFPKADTKVKQSGINSHRKSNWGV